jgi:hypothetical protein
MARPSINRENCDLHGLGAEPVQGLLAGLMQDVKPHLHEHLAGDAHRQGANVLMLDTLPLFGLRLTHDNVLAMRDLGRADVNWSGRLPPEGPFCNDP